MDGDFLNVLATRPGDSYGSAPIKPSDDETIALQELVSPRQRSTRR